MVYWISDANGPEPHDRGIFRCAPADIANPQAHTMLFNPQVRMRKYDHSGRRDSGVALCHRLALCHGDSSSPRIWARRGRSTISRSSVSGPPSAFNEKNSEGWFRVDLRSGWIERAEVMFIKPKHEGMTNDE